MTQKFLKEQLNTLPNYYYIDKDRVYGMDVPFVDFKKIKVLRQGVYLGMSLRIVLSHVILFIWLQILTIKEKWM